MPLDPGDKFAQLSPVCILLAPEFGSLETADCHFTDALAHSNGGLMVSELRVALFIECAQNHK